MTTLIATAYLIYWYATWSQSERSRPAYLQRMAVSAFVAGYFFLAGDVEKTFPGLLAEWLLVIDGFFFWNRLDNMHPLIFKGRSA